MRNLSGINEGADIVTKDYVDNSIPTKTSDLTNDSGFITADEKIKLTSVTNDSEYPVLLGPTSITSGSTYSGDYNTDITINPNSKQLTLKSIKLYYNDNCSATLATKGYVGNNKNHIPIVNFASTAANTSGTLDYYTYLSGVETPTSNASNYDTFVANKKYVDDKFGSIVVPTKTSDLTNDSGFVTTDEKVKATAYTEDGTQKYLIFGGNSGSAETKYYDAGLQYAANNTITTPKASLILGNTSLLGQVLFYKGNGNSVYTTLRGSSSGDSNTVTLPNATGTIALTSDIPTVPTNVSAFTNDAGYLTSYIETDPTVPSWAKASTKPTYTASEVGALASTTTYVSTVTTAAGAHTAISSKSGAVSFNVPTKTSHLTNDSGFITTDKNLEIAAVASGTTYYPIVAANSTAAATRQYDSSGFEYYNYNGTAGVSTNGQATLTLGNNISSSIAKWKRGILKLYGTTAYYVELKTANGKPTANRTITIPDATGTLALTSDIPSSAASATTGISISNHSTGSVIGVQSSTTTASKVTLGTAISVPNVTSVGSASTWTFEEKTIPNVTAAGGGSFTQGSFSGGSLTFAIDSTDNKQLNITFTAATHGADSHTHTAPTLGTAIKVQSKSGGGNGSAPTLGTAKSIPNVTGVSDVTVPIKNTSATTVVTSATHTVTDNGHTHNLS